LPTDTVADTILKFDDTPLRLHAAVDADGWTMTMAITAVAKLNGNLQ